VPRGEKPRRGNNEDDHDDEDAAVLIASILSLFLHLATSTVLHGCSSTLYMTKKKNKKGLYFWISFALQTS
jgi:hypothetical protein